MGFEAEFDRWKAEDLGPYCFTKCDRTCCDMRNVSLHVNKDELIKLFGRNIINENPKKTGIRTANPKGTYCVETKDYCPKFDPATRKCIDYNNRPKSCREFPFLVESGAITIKTGCPLDDRSVEYKKLAEIAVLYKKVIVKR